MSDQNNFKLEVIAKECGLILSDYPKYNYWSYCCYACSKWMIVFEWDSTNLWEEKEKPPEPIPKTVQWRYTQTINGYYWGNVCPFCNSVQGDWYLKMEPIFPDPEFPDYILNQANKEPETKEIERKPEQGSLW